MDDGLSNDFGHNKGSRFIQYTYEGIKMIVFLHILLVGSRILWCGTRKQEYADKILKIELLDISNPKHSGQRNTFIDFNSRCGYMKLKQDSIVIRYENIH